MNRRRIMFGKSWRRERDWSSRVVVADCGEGSACVPAVRPSHGCPPEGLLHPQNTMSGSSVRLIGFATFYFVYLLLGAAIFSSIEAPGETTRVQQLRRMRADFLNMHSCVQGKLVQSVPFGRAARIDDLESWCLTKKHSQMLILEFKKQGGREARDESQGR